MRIVLLGAPGSGKGTQGRVLAERLGVPYIGSGDLLRARAAAEPGSELAAVLDRGDLVGDDDLPMANGLVLGSSYGTIPLGAGAFAAVAAPD